MDTKENPAVAAHPGEGQEKRGKRNLVIACAVLLIGAAVVLNFVFFSSGKQGSYADYANGKGMSDVYGTTPASEPPSTQPQQSPTADSYFSSVQVSRQRARDEAIEVLQNVVDSADADAKVKQDALAEISKIALEMEKEANIETLIKAKGYTACVAVINGDSASIVVSGKALNDAQLAQINAIVYAQTGIAPGAVNIAEKN